MRKLALGTLAICFSVLSYGQLTNVKTVKEPAKAKAQKVEDPKKIEIETATATYEEVETVKHSTAQNEETLFHKLTMCESKIAHNPTTELNKEFNKLRSDFVSYVKATPLADVTEPEKAKYMSYMKEENNMKEYQRIKDSYK